ncbi:hypothetical protein ZWY2020_033992 [Hordeum vulgare]|nr:hypothetical protein ZWY2020_033992 [Hordeum vulgare]
MTQTRQKLPIKKKLVPQFRRSASSVVASSSTPDLSTTSIIDILQEQVASTQQSQTQIPGPLPESQFIAGCRDALPPPRSTAATLGLKRRKKVPTKKKENIVP